MDGVPTTRVALLDGFRLRLAGRTSHSTMEDMPRGLQRLVAHLGLFDSPARTAIAGHLWPDVPESHAHGSLRSALWRLQKLVPGLIRSTGETLALAENVRVDVWELIAWAHRAMDPHTGVDEVAAPDPGLSGELLPGWYDDWVLLERERFRQLRMHALEALANKLSVAGRFGEAVQAAYAAVQAEPLRESAHRTLVQVHIAEGNLVEAVRAFDAFRTMLSDELGVAPTAAMLRLVSRLPGPPEPPCATRNRLGDPYERHLVTVPPL